MTHDVEITTDPAAFLAAAEADLAADPVVTTVMATVTSRHRDERAAGEPPPVDRPEWWAIVRDADGAIAGLAMRTARTPPHPMFVLPDGRRRPPWRWPAPSTTAGRRWAASTARCPPSRCWPASSPACRAAGSRSPSTPACSSSASCCRRPVSRGALREATLDDFDLAKAWVDRFMYDADMQAGRDPEAHGREEIAPDDLVRKIEQGVYWFWLDEAGERVHLTGANPPAFGVARIGPVYTPPEQRRKGYAGAAVAQVSQLFLDAGARVCLYTDQANPTSNGIYQAIGYRPVVDQANLRIVGSGGNS